MTVQTFYQIDSMGRIREWDIQVVDNGTYSTIISNAGLQTGKKIETKTDVLTGLNLGKINSTTHYTQAVADAQTEIDKKVKSGWVNDFTQIKTKGETLTINAPMKAETYHPTGLLSDGSLKKGCYTLDGKAGSKKQTDSIRGKKICISRKIDGWRLRIYVDNQQVIFYTSSGDVTLSFPHIEKRVREVFDKNIGYWNKKYGVTSYILDGEIYAHNLKAIEKDGNGFKAIYEDNFNGFQLTSSACASIVNLTPEKLFLRSLMQFNIFDIILEDTTVPYSIRKKIIKYFPDEKNIKTVEEIEIIANEKEIDDLMQQFLNEGFEGLMIKMPEMPYEFKRSKYIFKYKPLMDDEFKIIGFKKSITGDTLGSFECIMPNGVDTFFANPMGELGTDAAKKEIWDNQQNYIGKWVTCCYLELTSDEIPRHPRARNFRKGKSKD